MYIIFFHSEHLWNSSALINVVHGSTFGKAISFEVLYCPVKTKQSVECIYVSVFNNFFFPLKDITGIHLIYLLVHISMLIRSGC